MLKLIDIVGDIMKHPHEKQEEMQYEKKTGNACTGRCDGNVITDRMRAER